MAIRSTIFVFLILTVGVFVTSCGNVKNSSSSDATTYATSESKFAAAKAILASKCFACHSWSSYTEANFVADGLVKKKDPANSTLYTRIRGNDLGIAGDMPQSGSDLTAAEVQTMKSWINE